MAEVKIISRTKLVVWPKPEQPEVVVSVTYQSGFFPPRTVYIKETEYSVDKEREAIKADLEKAAAAKPETYEL
jgi:hypothetical protein